MGWHIFQDTEGTSATAKMNDTSYESLADFHGDETKEKYWILKFWSFESKIGELWFGDFKSCELFFNKLDWDWKCD